MILENLKRLKKLHLTDLVHLPLLSHTHLCVWFNWLTQDKQKEFFKL